MYSQLSAGDQHRVNQVLHNVMSYRKQRAALTPGQLDRMTAYSNGTVHHVTDGYTYFVDHQADPLPADGSLSFPYVTVGDGLMDADPGDIDLIRRGSYNEAMTIDQDVTLRASKGNATIGGLP